MIKVNDGVFYLATPKTSYIFKVGECDILEHLYYGKRLDCFNVELLSSHQEVKFSDGIAYNKDHIHLFLQNLMTEFSTQGRGDYRMTAMKACYDNGHSTLDFVYDAYEIQKGAPIIEGLPCAYGDDFETLVVTLKETLLPLTVKLYYVVSDTTDVIVRYTTVENNGTDCIYIQALASLQLDIPNPDWNLITLDGAWSRERFIHEAPLRQGIHINDSKNGASSAMHNPAIALRSPKATNFQGDVYGFNLIYSGNHQESVEVSIFGRTRVLTGINPQTFTWKLEGGSKFTTPQAVMTYSHEGLNGMTQQMHQFVQNCICRGYWSHKERPILINNWEATGFKFDEKKILDLADCAKDVGLELLVLDDGWFGKRNDDTTSLGDWFVNKEKLPNGIVGLADAVHKKGLMFGLWFEPEMISEDSDLFRAHPDWRISIPNRAPGVGRNQYVLDMTREEVTDYLIACISSIIENSKLDYIKWDFNRFISDPNTQGSNQYFMGEFYHRYVMGFYKVLGTLVNKYPKILFEGCSAGGNRFDLGALCYTPQIWASDDTDVFMRQYIQDGTSLFYPISSIGAHVSASPNKQTMRISSIDDRFNVAAFGAFGYELDLTKLSKEELEAVKKQVEFYKENRKLFQYGKFFRISDYGEGKGKLSWAVTDGKKTVVLNGYMHSLISQPNDNRLTVPIDEMTSEAVSQAWYKVSKRTQLIDKTRLDEKRAKLIEDGRYTNEYEVKVPGGQLANAGVVLPQRFTGNGDIRLIRILPDFSTELYIIERL